MLYEVITSRSVDYLRTKLADLPPEIDISLANWATEPALRAFFARPEDLSGALGRSRNLRTFFAKYPELDHAHIILGMTFSYNFV